MSRVEVDVCVCTEGKAARTGRGEAETLFLPQTLAEAFLVAERLQLDLLHKERRRVTAVVTTIHFPVGEKGVAVWNAWNDALLNLAEVLKVLPEPPIDDARIV